MDEDNLTRRLELMRRDSHLDDALIDDFGRWIRSAPDEELFRVDTLEWARRHQRSEDEALDLFLHAAKAGIFELAWGVICPFCGMLIQTPGGLRALRSNPHCKLCQVDFPASADDQVQVTFSLEAGVRRLRFYDPEGVDLNRDALRIFFGPTVEEDQHTQGFQSILRVGRGIAPGGEAVLECALTAGLSALIVPNVHAIGFLHVEPGLSTEASFEVHDGAMLPSEIGLGEGAVRLRIANRTHHHITACVMALPSHRATGEPARLQIRPFLSGKRVLTSQTFRDLFRTETIGEGGLSIKSLTMVFTDLQASTALYERVGDLRALELVRAHFERLGEVVRRHRGAVVKTIGDAVMAAFGEPERALAAATGMSRALRKIDADGENLTLKIGVHSGSCIAVQTNHQIDYFGSAVNIAARVQGVAHGGEIVVTDSIWKVPGVPGLVDDFGLSVTPDLVSLRGIAAAVPVYRLR